MRPSTASLALAALLLLACGLTLAAASGGGGGTGTPAPSASPAGDARPRARRVAPPEETEEGEDEDVEESADAATSDDPEPPEPPRRALRIVDGDGDPVGGVSTSAVTEDSKPTDPPCGCTTGADGEASFLADGDVNRVAFFDGAAEQKLELREPMTEVVVRDLPTLLVSAVDARSGNSLDPVRFRVRCSCGGEREVWTGGKRPALAVSSSGTVSCTVAVDAPAGYGGYGATSWSGELALRAKTARLVVPLFEATSRTLRAVDREGAPLPGVTVARASADAHGPLERWTTTVTFRAETSAADGLLLVEGMPRIPFTRIELSVGRADGDATSSSGMAAPFDPCADAPEQPIVVVLNGGGRYRGPSGEVPG